MFLMMSGMNGMDGMSQPNPITQLLESMPDWLSSLVITLAVLAIAALAGVVLGRVYSWIRYPNPEKPSMFNWKQKVVFLAVLVIGVGFLYYSIFVPEPDPTLPDEGGSISGEMSGEPSADGGSTNGGGMIIGGGDGAAVAVPMG